MDVNYIKLQHSDGTCKEPIEMYETRVGNGEDVIKYHAVMVEIAIYFVEFGDINKFATKHEDRFLVGHSYW